MAGQSGYIYTVRMPLTAVTAAKTLLQIKTGAAAIDILAVRVYQTTKTGTEFQALQLSRWNGATPGTVTSATPVKANRLDPAALCVGGTAATGYNASAEPSGGTQDLIDEDSWNVLNGGWYYLDIPEGRIRLVQGGDLFTVKLNTAPSASQTTGCVVKLVEYQ